MNTLCVINASVVGEWWVNNEWWVHSDVRSRRLGVKRRKESSRRQRLQRKRWFGHPLKNLISSSGRHFLFAVHMKSPHFPWCSGVVGILSQNQSKKNLCLAFSIFGLRASLLFVEPIETGLNEPDNLDLGINVSTTRVTGTQHLIPFPTTSNTHCRHKNLLWQRFHRWIHSFTKRNSQYSLL